MGRGWASGPAAGLNKRLNREGRQKTPADVVAVANDLLPGVRVLGGALNADELPGVSPVQPALLRQVVLPQVVGDDLAALESPNSDT